MGCAAAGWSHRNGASLPARPRRLAPSAMALRWPGEHCPSPGRPQLPASCAPATAPQQEHVIRMPANGPPILPTADAPSWERPVLGRTPPSRLSQDSSHSRRAMVTRATRPDTSAAGWWEPTTHGELPSLSNPSRPTRRHRRSLPSTAHNRSAYRWRSGFRAQAGSPHRCLHCCSTTTCSSLAPWHAGART